MATQNANLQERYGTIVEAKLRAVSVFNQLFNHQYEGTPAAGAVKVPVRTDATVSAYDIANGLAMNNAGTTYQTIVLEDYAVNELIDGYEAAAVPDGKVAERLDSAGYALGNKIDSLLCAAAEAGTGAADTATDLVEAIINTIAMAKKAKVDPSKIWVAVDPDTEAAIMTSTLFVHAAADVQNGVIGKLGGVPVVTSNNMTKSFVVGNSDFCHAVMDWKMEPSLVDLKDGAHIGASAVQGRYVFGCLVSKPATIFVK